MAAIPQPEITMGPQQDPALGKHLKAVQALPPAPTETHQVSGPASKSILLGPEGSNMSPSEDIPRCPDQGELTQAEI